MIKLLGRKYDVTGNSDEGNYGDVHHGNRVITVNKRLEMHIDQAVDSLIHECIHVMDTALDLKLDENQVRLLTTGIASLIRDNNIPDGRLKQIVLEGWEKEV